MAATAALRSNWRKVSSTDNLQAFADDGFARDVACCSWRSKLIGLGMLLLAAVLFVADLLVLVSKAPYADGPSTPKLLSMLRDNQYYLYLVPLMVPMAVLWVTVNWFSLKLFKHNS